MLAARNPTVFKMVTYKPSLSRAAAPRRPVGTKMDNSFFPLSSSYSFSSAASAAEGTAAAYMADDVLTPRPEPLKSFSHGAVFIPSRPEYSMVQLNIQGHTNEDTMAATWSQPQFCPPSNAANGQNVPSAAPLKQRMPTGAGDQLNRHLQFPSNKLLPDAHEPAQGFIHAPRIAGNANNIAVAAITTKSVGNTSVVVVPAAAHHHEAYQRRQGSATLQNDTVGGPVLININRASCAPVVAATAGVVPGEFASGATETRAVAGVQLGSKWAELLAASPIVSKWVHPISYPQECSVVCGGGKQSGYLTAAAICCPGNLVSQTAVLLVLLEMLLLMQRVSDRHLLQLQLRSTQAPLH